MAKNNNKRWMQKAFGKNKGALHRMLGIPEDQKIPWDILVAASKSKNKLKAARARVAMTARKANK